MSYARPPELWPVNRDAWQLWQLVQTQWRVGASGPAGLVYAEVRHQAREWEIPLGRRNMRKIQALEREALTYAHSAGQQRDINGAQRPQIH